MHIAAALGSYVNIGNATVELITGRQISSYHDQ